MLAVSPLSICTSYASWLNMARVTVLDVPELIVSSAVTAGERIPKNRIDNERSSAVRMRRPPEFGVPWNRAVFGLRRVRHAGLESIARDFLELAARYRGWETKESL